MLFIFGKWLYMYVYVLDNAQYCNSRRTLRLPALPPPTRRRISAASEQVLVDALTLMHRPHAPLPSPPPPPPPRPVRHSVPYYRRRRRSIVHHRPKTPTLSPIRESGLSNPASPSRQSECANTISVIGGGSCIKPL